MLILARIYMGPCRTRIFEKFISHIPALEFTQICGHFKMRMYMYVI